MLRIVALLANLGWLGFMLYIVATEEIRDNGIFWAEVAFASIAINLFALWRQNEKSLVGLFFRRLRLQEQKKIDDLSAPKA